MQTSNCKQNTTFFINSGITCNEKLAVGKHPYVWCVWFPQSLPSPKP